MVVKGGGRRTSGLHKFAGALPALHPGISVAPRLDPLGGDFGLGGNLNRGSRFFGCPARREVLHPSHKVGALLLCESAPLRHIRAVKSTGDGIEQIFVGGQSSGRSGAALKHAQLKIAGLGVDPGEALTVTVPQVAMATDAIAAVDPPVPPRMNPRAFRVSFPRPTR